MHACKYECGRCSPASELAMVWLLHICHLLSLALTYLDQEHQVNIETGSGHKQTNVVKVSCSCTVLQLDLTRADKSRQTCIECMCC